MMSRKHEAALKRRREFAAEMRPKGYKRVVRWVSDTANSAFIEEYKRQIAVLTERQRQHGAINFLPPEEDLPCWV